MKYLNLVLGCLLLSACADNPKSELTMEGVCRSVSDLDFGDHSSTDAGGAGV